MADGWSGLREHVRAAAAIAFVVLIASCEGDDSEKATSGEFCATFGAHAGLIVGTELGEDGADVQASFERLLPVVHDLDEQAPTEIRAEVRELTEFLREFDPMLARYGYSFERAVAEGTPADVAFLFSGGPIESYDAVAAYVETNCHGVVVPE